MPCGIFSIFKTKKAIESLHSDTVSPSSSPVQIPRHRPSPGSTPNSHESDISPTAHSRPRRGAIFPAQDDDEEDDDNQRRHFRSSIYSQRPRDISFPAPSSIYSRPTAAPSSEREIVASQTALFGNYSMGRPAPPASRRREFCAVVRQRFAAFRRRCCAFCRRRRERSRLRRLLEGEYETAGVVQRSAAEYDDDAVAYDCSGRGVCGDDDYDDDVDPHRLGLDIPPDSYAVLVRETGLAMEEEEEEERRESCDSYVSVFAEERESERMKDTEEFLFGGGWNEFGNWNDRSFLMWR
ncbi:hypothetical protein IWZ00DRAFT_108651 [Phyllosticta capitalensis]